MLMRAILLCLVLTLPNLWRFGRQKRSSLPISGCRGSCAYCLIITLLTTVCIEERSSMVMFLCYLWRGKWHDLCDRSPIVSVRCGSRCCQRFRGKWSPKLNENLDQHLPMLDMNNWDRDLISCFLYKWCRTSCFFVLFLFCVKTFWRKSYITFWEIMWRRGISNLHM